MQKAHDASYNNYWENLPSVQTPIIAAQLNRNEQTVDEIDDRVITLDTNKADQSDLDDAVKSVTLTAGTFEIEHFDGTINTYDTDLNVIPKSYDFIDNPNDAHYKNLAIILANGSVDYADMTGVITENDFTTSGTINYAISTSGSVSFDIVDYSITDTKMQPNYLSDITAQAGIATNAATASANSKKDSEAWAVGTRDGVPVGPTDPTYNNNAQYYATHGAGSSLVGMTDVDVSTVSNGQIIRYNSSTTMWENADETTGLLPHLIILSETGSRVTVNKTGIPTIYATETSTGHYECDVPSFGTYTIDAILGGDDAQVSLNVDAVKVFTVDDSHFYADITVTYPTGATVSCSKSGETTMYATGSPYTFTVHATGTWTLTCVKGGITKTTTVSITTSGQTESYNFTPTGSTVTPTDDVETLLLCAGVWDSTLTTISAVISDASTLSAVIASNNAVDYLVRSTIWVSDFCSDSTAMSYIGLNNYCANTLLTDADWLDAIVNSTYKESVLNVKVPAMTDATHPSGEVISSGQYTNYYGYKAFDGTNSHQSDSWLTGGVSNVYIGYIFVNQTKVVNVYIENRTLAGGDTSVCEIKTFKIQGSNDGTTWVDITDVLTNVSGELVGTYFIFDNNNYYSGYRVFVLSSYNSSYVGAGKIQFYGREDV